ncbi:MAG: potassium channel family protein [Chloroflexia bacterium]
MSIVAVILGIALIVLVGQDAFETIVLPRRVTRRIRFTTLFYRLIHFVWYSVGRLIRTSTGRDAFFGYIGPLSLLALVVFWASLFVLGYGLVMWGLALPLESSANSADFLTYLYLSGTTFFTLGLGDVDPQSGVGRFLVVSEVALGFTFLALVISYVPVLYQSFSRRELRISLLGARAGSPATAVELLRRNTGSPPGRAGRDVEELRMLLHEWEEWCADILESHLSYPVLAFYRSQHEQQSWVEALTLILDTCALLLTGIEGMPIEPARFTFAMARHAVVDLAQVLNTAPRTTCNRLSPGEYARLQAMLAEAGLRLREGSAAEQDLADLRATYEPFVSALAERIQVSLPPWIPPGDTLDDWETSAWDDQLPSTRQTLNKVIHPNP